MVTPLGRAAIETAHQMGLLPLVAVAVAQWQGKKPDAGLWWLSVAFGVSWLADSAAHWLNPWTITFTYVISQSALVGAVFLARKDALRLLGALLFVGGVAMFARDAAGHDYLLHGVAWLSAACIAAEECQTPALRRVCTALVVYYGIGCVAYFVYAGWPGWTTWGVYQSTRLMGIALFCYAVWHPISHLSVMRQQRRMYAA